MTETMCQSFRQIIGVYCLVSVYILSPFRYTVTSNDERDGSTSPQGVVQYKVIQVLKYHYLSPPNPYCTWRFMSFLIPLRLNIIILTQTQVRTLIVPTTILLPYVASASGLTYCCCIVLAV